MEQIQEELRKKAFHDILSHKYFIHGDCFNCGKEYSYCTNKKSSNKDFYCSDECWKESKKLKRKRDREKIHYEVYKDNEFYYIVENGEFFSKRSFDGKTWMKKSEQERQKSDDVLKRIKNWEHLILSESSKIPEKVIKIIDKVSAYLYDDKHKFSDWKKLKEVKKNN